MSPFEDYIHSLGYRPFRKIDRNGSLTEIPLSRCSSFSTMEPGGITNFWIFGNSTILWGLHEKGKPPTLDYPRPPGIFNDDQMNRILKDNTPEEVYKMITL